MWKNLAVLLTGLLLLLGLASSKFSAQLGVVAGSEGVGSIPLENYPQANSIGSAVLALILFDGRLRTSMASVQRVWKPAQMNDGLFLLSRNLRISS